jgi:glycosyltransferase involved in cell wall biosynthesis
VLSIVIPIHNDESLILPLYDRLTPVLDRLRRPYEILFIDEASRDRSFELLANLVETDGHLKVIQLRRNFGRTAALSAGFDEAQGEIIVTMDGDSRYAVDDIPILLAKLDEGFDIAIGWRRGWDGGSARDRLSSRVTNWLAAKASKVHLFDSGSSLNAYRAEILKNVNLYGELHHLIPALAAFYGARIAQVPIHERPLAGAVSEERRGRMFRMIFDIVTIRFLLKYLTRPMHFFGKWGLVSVGLSSLVLAVLAVPKIWTTGDILQQHGPLVVMCALALLVGVILFCAGILGELLTRTYYESQGRRIYSVQEIRTRKPAGAA